MPRTLHNQEGTTDEKGLERFYREDVVPALRKKPAIVFIAWGYVAGVALTLAGLAWLAWELTG